MQDIQYKPSTGSGTNIYKQIECFDGITQSGWKTIGFSGVLGKSSDRTASIIDEANSLIDIVEYLNTFINLEHISSSAGWNYRTYCPFHKGGNERTPSFFINEMHKRFFCQACGFTGGIVQFIAKKFLRPEIIVAEHIFKCVNGKVDIDADKINKINARKKVQQTLLQISDKHRQFILSNQNDQDAIEYIFKIMKGFDNVYDKNQEGVELSIENISNQLSSYLEKYEEK